MDLHTQQTTFKDYHSSKRVEYPLSDEMTPIKLAFPSMREISWAKMKGQCLKIDHCQIKYSPQVPANAEGSVIVSIHDTRMESDKSLQAEYTFPIRCGIELNFFSMSYFSLRDEVPWRAYYRVVNTTVLKGSFFCQIKARVKLSASKTSQAIQFRGPSVRILSPDFTESQVDFMHCSIPKSERLICRSSSVIVSRPRFEIGPGESWHSKSVLSGDSGSDVGNGPYAGLQRLGPEAINPGDSASVVADDRMKMVDMGPRSKSVVGEMGIDPEQFARIIGDAVARGSEIGLSNDLGSNAGPSKPRL
ncbi:movement protein [Myrica rubra citlodavirus 1]|nr:movement protein [Myrica rubra citlodavirus 1]